MLGTIVAMMGSMALGGIPATTKVWTAAGFPFALGTGLVLGILVSGSTTLMLSAFVVVMFAAVYIRRFGPAFFFYGFMVWMGYFFAAFLHPTLAQLPGQLAAVAVSAAWVLLLSLTVLRTNTRRTLRRIRQAFDARSRAVARAAADLLESEDPQKAGRRRRLLHARQLGLAETALMIEGWSGQPGALPGGWSGPALRRRMLDLQLAVEALATAAGSATEADGPTRQAAARIARALADRDLAAVERLALPLLDPSALVPRPTGRPGDRGPGSMALPAAPTSASGATGAVEGVWAASHLAAAAMEYVDLARQGDAPPATGTSEQEYEPAVQLAMGNLPGSAAIAGGVAARGRHWNVFARMKLTTRQAIQVAVAGGVAILVGREINEQRYYWAVIAAFVAFTGTATRSETTLKATNRVAGTLVGLGAGIGMVHVTAGHTLTALAVIILAMACGFYLVRISYGLMIFFVTIMVSQLYSILNEFSPGLLMLRLEETAAGAAIGILVGLLVLPTSTRDTLHSARTTFYSALSTLLEGVAGRLDGSEPETDLDAQARAIDHQVRGLALVASPLTRPLVWGNDPRLTRHRLTLYAAVSRRGRTLALAPQRLEVPNAAAEYADAARSLAAAAAHLADHPALTAAPHADVEQHLRDAEHTVLARRPECSAQLPPVGLALTQLGQLLRELAAVRPLSGPKHRRTPPPKLRLLASSASGTSGASGDSGPAGEEDGRPEPPGGRVPTASGAAGRERPAHH
ncbi:FUSC family protein [Streptomyces montanisoli]|uniref:FUSC family protein n=1 Tax=Streptomyces montanisoli TaxID=2798581 RepID=A0A940RTX2_9ACTN|nr:FUSC family protein [Streptomyces montanisoli]MBP0457342.1 FUSC family protein [Streptomyces montanisoli]